MGCQAPGSKFDDISHVDSTCTDASEQSEPSEPNGEPVWLAIHIRHATFCTEYMLKSVHNTY